MPDFTGSLIDHLNVGVPDLSRSLAFYEPTLASLGIVKVMEVPADEESGQLEMHGFGWAHKPFLWLVAGGSAGEQTHVALIAENRAAVRGFYETALAAGGRPLLEPGLRPEYQPDYYGAFVLDPDGINVESVCHRPE